MSIFPVAPLADQCPRKGERRPDRRVHVLLKVYAKCIERQDEEARRR
jgi:hypothetical protein